MSPQLGPRRVIAPDGAEWHVGRRWLTSRPRLNRPPGREIASESLSSLGNIGNVDLREGLLIVTAPIAFLLILIPVLFFGVELIIVGALLAAGVIARTLLRQPWVVEARAGPWAAALIETRERASSRCRGPAPGTDSASIQLRA
jgi:hypothetical protein